MRLGVLQQVDSPKALYDHPVNLFVAGFIGSPAMNFMPATVEGDRLKLPFGEVALPDELRRRLETSGSGNRQVIAGIRPEDFEDAAIVGDDKSSHGHAFETTVSLTESLGSDIFAYFEFEGEAAQSEELQDLAADAGTLDVPGGGDPRVVARVDPTSQVQQGQRARLWMDTSKLHIFDPQDGRNLTRAEGTASGAVAAG
jgi:multiple sugar transport system ATP-binding protein